PARSLEPRPGVSCRVERGHVMASVLADVLNLVVERGDGAAVRSPLHHPDGGGWMEPAEVVAVPVGGGRDALRPPSGMPPVASRVGLEPTTLRLTAGCSAIELPRIGTKL